MGINKKKIKKVDLSVTERHFGVVLENIDSKIDLVLEGHQALDVKFTKKFEEVDERLDIIDEKLDIHTEILSEHGKILTEHSKMIASINGNMEIMKQDIEFIKNSLKKKVDIDEFSVLEKRVALLEKKLQRT